MRKITFVTQRKKTVHNLCTVFLLCAYLIMLLTGIHIAARKGYLRCIERLLEKHPDLIDVKDTEDNLPLHLAAKYNW